MFSQVQSKAPYPNLTPPHTLTRRLCRGLTFGIVIAQHHRIAYIIPWYNAMICYDLHSSHVSSLNRELYNRFNWYPLIYYHQIPIRVSFPYHFISSKGFIWCLAPKSANIKITYKWKTKNKVKIYYNINWEYPIVFAGVIIAVNCRLR